MISLFESLRSEPVRRAAEHLKEHGSLRLVGLLELSRALAVNDGNEDEAACFAAELAGYGEGAEEEIPENRRIDAFASPFPIRAIDMGLIDPEEVFIVNRDKFSQVRLTLHQPAADLEEAVDKLEDGGVVTLQVPAAEVTGRSADTDDVELVYVYILPKEIRRVLEGIRATAVSSIVGRLVQFAVSTTD
ncbi:MAG: hypothetical protein HC923_06220 [Myxococcales bacterium]|nr:hypothetical protein [Myxococcales bacterium]